MIGAPPPARNTALPVFIALVVFYLVAWWAVVVIPRNDPAVELSEDIPILSMAQGFGLAVSLSGQEPRSIGFYQVEHPGVPFQLASWIVYRLTAHDFANGSPASIDFVLRHPERFYYVYGAAAAVIALMGALFMGGLARRYGIVFALATALSVFVWRSSFPWLLWTLSDETFAPLLVAALTFVAFRAFTGERAGSGTWIALGIVLALAYLNKLLWITWSVAALVAWLAAVACEPARFRRHVLDGLALCAGFGATVALVGFAMFGWSGLARMLSVHFSYLWYSGHYGSGAPGVVSMDMLIDSWQRMRVSIIELLVLAATGGGLLAIAAQIAIARWRDVSWRARQVPLLVLLGSSFLFSFAAPIKTYYPHYLTPCAALIAPLMLWVAANGGARLRQCAAIVVLCIVALMAGLNVDDRPGAAAENRSRGEEVAAIESLPLGGAEVRLWTYHTFGRRYIPTMVLEFGPQPLVVKTMEAAFASDWSYYPRRHGSGYRSDAGGWLPLEAIPWRYAVFLRSEPIDPRILEQGSVVWSGPTLIAVENRAASQSKSR